MARIPDSWLPDWRDASAYSFAQLDRRGFAWEWLRRDPAYRDAALAALGNDADRVADAASWGLVRFEHPHLAVPVARPIWLRAIDASVLCAMPCDSASACFALHLSALRRFITIAAAPDRTHVLVTDGWRQIRFDVGRLVDPSRPWALHWEVLGLAHAGKALDELARLISFARLGRFASRLSPRETRAHRWELALRAHDALAAGARQRNIATLFSAAVLVERWRVDEPCLRLRAQRLTHLSASLVGLGFAARYLG